MNHRNRVHTPIVWLALTVLPAAALADIYTWVDANGVTHYSSSRPAGQPANAFPTDPAFRSPARPGSGSTQPGLPGESEALRQRVEALEGLLDSERSARVADLKDQLENERDRVKRLEAERSQWLDVGGLWTSPAMAPAGLWWNPAPVLLVPGDGRPAKHGKHDRIKARSDGGRLPYPSISGPSSNLR